MPRTYDEDGQPMMSNKAMLQMLVKDIPVIYKDLRGLMHDMETELKRDITTLDKKLSTKIDCIASDLKGLHLQVHQNHTLFVTNQEELGKRVAVLEAA